MIEPNTNGAPTYTIPTATDTRRSEFAESWTRVWLPTQPKAARLQSLSFFAHGGVAEWISIIGAERRPLLPGPPIPIRPPGRPAPLNLLNELASRVVGQRQAMEQIRGARARRRSGRRISAARPDRHGKNANRGSIGGDFARQ